MSARVRSGLWSMVALCAALGNPRLGWVAVCACLAGACMVAALLIGERWGDV